MSCPNCDLLRKYGFGDRICKACAEKFTAAAKALGEAYAAARDKFVKEALGIQP